MSAFVLCDFRWYTDRRGWLCFDINTTETTAEFWQNFELTLGPGDQDSPELAVLGPHDVEAGAGEEEEERRHQGGQGQGEGHAAGQPGVHAVTIRLGMATCVKIAPLQFCCGLSI